MQSFLAYKRFGKHVESQYQRDRKRAEALTRGNNEELCPADESEETIFHRSSQIESPSSNSIRDSSQDPEKTEPALSPWTDGGGTGDANEEELQLETIKTARTNQSFGTRMGHTLNGIEVRQLSPQLSRIRTKRSQARGKTSGSNINPKKEERETVFVVGYESEKDILDPHNWSYATRLGCTVMIASIGWIVGFASAVDSAALPQAAEEFGVSEVAESLATGLFLVAFGFGALVAGPISETVGRNPVYIVTLAVYMVWIMASALAPNLGAQLVFRFLAGLFGATPLTCAGGSISDLWSPLERVWAFPVFANAAFSKSLSSGFLISTPSRF